MAAGGAARPRAGGRRWIIALLVVLVLAAAAVGVLLPVATSGVAPAAPARSTAPAAPVRSTASAPAAPRGTVERILERADRNADGSLSVEVTERETTALVRAGLARTGAPAIEGLRVDLVQAAGDAAGTMVLDGRLEAQGLPVQAVVDLVVLDGRIRPTVREVRVGPLPLSGGVRDDLNRELATRSPLIDAGLIVEDLRTTERGLVLRGRGR